LLHLNGYAGNAKHRSQFEAAIGVSGGTHGMFSKEALQHMYEAQSLWDEYMAESVARYTSVGHECQACS
jgi:hypothetical protein